jgi:alpha-tubulin suppressor-like RCC1 family protein
LTRNAWRAGLLLGIIAGCADWTSLSSEYASSDGPVPDAGPQDAPSVACEAPCAVGNVCVGGSCVPCGAVGEPCCTAEGAACESPNICVSGTCGRCVDQLSAGSLHTCARKHDGTAWCWGDPEDGQLGDGETGPAARFSPVEVIVDLGTRAPLSDVVELAAGNEQTCARSGGGGLWCWGLNDYGELGNGNTTRSDLPVVVGTSGAPFAGASSVRASARSQFSCSLKGDRSVWCWGRNDSGQVGDDSVAANVVPQVVVARSGSQLPLTDSQAIAVGGEHACALSTGSALVCWGANMSNQLGDGTTTNRLAPVAAKRNPTDPLSGVLAVAASLGTTCALLQGSPATVWCWGANDRGQCGTGTATASPVIYPAQVVRLSDNLALTGVTQLSAGIAHFCARTADGRAWCWGGNQNGEAGNQTSSDLAAAVTVLRDGGMPLENVESVSCGGTHTCALQSDGTPLCWGANQVGQLGRSQLAGPANVPGQVAITAAMCK